MFVVLRITNNKTKKMNLSNLKPANMEIKVLGTGCAKCKALEKATREAVGQTGVNATITKVEDIVEIMKYNVMTTPALVVDGEIVVKGKVPSVDEIKKFLAQ